MMQLIKCLGLDGQTPLLGHLKKANQQLRIVKDVQKFLGRDCQTVLRDLKPSFNQGRGPPLTKTIPQRGFGRPI